MGLFSFIKSAGEKLFGKEEKVEAQSAPVVEAAPDYAFESKFLIDTISNMGLEIAECDVQIAGDVATISGLAKDQATREKAILIVGNSQGIATVDDQLKVEVQEPEAVFHTVAKGDSLSKIAKEHYGNAMKYPVIFEANKPMLSDPDKIYPGQVLRIPAI